MIIKNKKYLFLILGLILFGCLIYFPVFLHLDTLPMRIWDESRYSINAQEMYKAGHFLVPHFEGKPDLWNAKPPLLVWFQVLIFNIFGVGELAIRLPSAIAAFLTAVTLLGFSVKYLKDYWFGLIAALILVTCQGYINTHHGTRTGDPDSLVTFFTTTYTILFFLFLEHKNKKYLHLFFLMLTLAIYTKSIQGMLFLPALFLYSVFTRKLGLLFNKWFFIDLLICILIVVGYYLIREYYYPGYLDAVWKEELGGRYLISPEGTQTGFWFYSNILIKEHFIHWYWLIPFGALTGFLIKDEKVRRFTFFILLMAFSYWLIISLGKTRKEWYDMLLFPYLALIAAIPIHFVFTSINNSEVIFKSLKFNIIPYIFLFIVFVSPYNKKINKVLNPQELPWDVEFYHISYFLKDAVKSNESINDLCYRGYKAHLMFYVNTLNDFGHEVNFRDWHNLESGDLVIASQQIVKDYIEENYSVNKKTLHYNVEEYNIHERLPADSTSISP